jgi:hypothetical protein
MDYLSGEVENEDYAPNSGQYDLLCNLSNCGSRLNPALGTEFVEMAIGAKIGERAQFIRNK